MQIRYIQSVTEELEHIRLPNHARTKIDNRAIPLVNLRHPAKISVPGTIHLVGSDTERATGRVYPGDWVIVTGYATYYTPHLSSPAYHTGSDLIAQSGETPHYGIHAMADGTVICSRRFFGSTWGNVIYTLMLARRRFWQPSLTIGPR